ncbi:translation initiation factor IF-3 [bacterium]|nr:translation initiation factor IF-3 [bacterium]
MSIRPKRFKGKSRDPMVRVNNRIYAPEIRVVGPEGDQLGVLSVREALDLAREEGLDLVEISPGAKPPVCKITDYGKFRYEQQKKAKENKKKQKLVTVKEVRIRPKISGHDYDFKADHCREFLEKGDKVRIRMMFRGRENIYKNKGREMLLKLAEELGEEVVIESPPKSEGKQMIMVLAPR